MTILGKFLVLATVLCSFVFLALAASIYLASPNWGWDPKHAKKEFGQPIPSEIDKRKPLITELAKARSRALAGWTDAAKQLADVESKIPMHQLRYDEELDRIRNGEAIARRALEAAKPWLFEKDAKGKPLFEFGPIANTVAGLNIQLSDLLTKIEDKRKQITPVIAEEKELTEQLNGKVVMDKQEKGLYALIILEEEVRKRAQEELEELRPGYYEELVLSQLLLKRQASLKARIEELKTTAPAKPQE